MKTALSGQIWMMFCLTVCFMPANADQPAATATVAAETTAYRLSDYYQPRRAGSVWLYQGPPGVGSSQDTTHTRVRLVDTAFQLTLYHPAAYLVPVLLFDHDYGCIKDAKFVSTDNWQEYASVADGFAYYGHDDDADSSRFPMTPLPATMAVGQSVTRSGMLYDRDGQAIATISLTIELVEHGRVTVPAGIFPDCVRLRFSLGAADGTQVQEEWWAKGVGLVKHVRLSGYDEECNGGKYHKELLAYAVATALTSQTVGRGSTVIWSVAATSAGAVTHRWQGSSNAGKTWSNLGDAAPYSGVSTATLKLSAASVALSGRQYRCVQTVGGETILSTAGKLTVLDNAAPTIGAIANQKTNRNTATKAIAFKVADAETAATKLKLTKGSSNPTLLPVANIVLGGSGTSRTVALKPAANKTGTAKVTLTVSDGVLTAVRVFTLTVNTPPAITKIADQTVAKNQSTAVLKFSIGDVETAPVKLTVTKASSNTALVPSTGIMIGGTAANRTVKVTPVANKTGSAKITLTVSDGSATTTSSFTVTVAASAKKTDLLMVSPETSEVGMAVIAPSPDDPSRSQTGRPADESPRPQAEPNVAGTYSASETATLTLTADGESDVETFTGTNTVVVTQSGRTFTYTIRDPSSGIGLTEHFVLSGNRIVSGSGPVIAFQTVSGLNISENKITSATGLVSLNRIDLTVRGSVKGSLDGVAFAIAVVATVRLDGIVTPIGSNSAPTISAIANQTTNRNVTLKAVAFKITDTETAASKLKLTRASSNTALLPVANITFGGSGANRTVTLKPATNKTGTAKVTLTVSDGVLTAKRTFTLTVNAPPTITKIAAQTIKSGASTSTLKFKVADAETAASKLKVTAKSSNTAMVATAGIVLGGSGANRTVKVTPVKGKTGSAKITLTVSDGHATAATSFTVTVTASATKSDVEGSTVGKPTITTQPQSQAAKVGAAVTLTVAADEATSYRWTHDGADLSGADSATLKLSAVQLTDAGGYAVTATNAAGSTTSTPAELTVVEAKTAATRSSPILAVTQTVTVAGAADGVRLSVPLPSGWRYLSGETAGAATHPEAGDRSLLEWTWTKMPVEPVAFTYVLEMPANQAVPGSLDALLDVTADGAQTKLLFDEPTGAK